jgi:ring-1,2-phenylacetyl-CoA epoxidase subunit PaaD
VVTALALSVEDVMRVLESVPDPEIPVVSVCGLGIIREVAIERDGVRVVVTPTYSGCPATEVIAASIREALVAAGAGDVRIETRLSPAWTTDWITPAARASLAAYGIVPPGQRRTDGAQPIRLMARSVSCPRCGGRPTTQLSAFGATACKALYRCEVCREPFEVFKEI